MKRVSRKDAIAAFCKACLYSKDEPGTWRAQIEACTALKCPLYPVRPRSTVRPVAVQNEAEKGQEAA